MINKKNLWFLTLFSLVLVLSVYYVTMPNDLLQASTTKNAGVLEKTNKKEKVVIKESDAISALKVEDNTKTEETINTLQETISSKNSTTEEKNKAYETLKEVNNKKAKEETLEQSIKKEYKCNAFTKIDNTNIRVVVDGCENSKTTANNIMRLVQNNFEEKMYISVEFKS